MGPNANKKSKTNKIDSWQGVPCTIPDNVSKRVTLGSWASGPDSQMMGHPNFFCTGGHDPGIRDEH